MQNISIDLEDSVYNDFLTLCTANSITIVDYLKSIINNEVSGYRDNVAVAAIDKSDLV